MVANIVLTVSAIVVLQMRRKIEPIKSRSPLVLSTMMVPLCATTVGVCLAKIYLETYNCTLTILQDYMYQSVLIVLVLIRVGFTYAKFQIAHESYKAVQERIRESDNEIVERVDTRLLQRFIWSKYRKWLKGTKVNIIAWGILSVLMIPAFIFAGVLQDSPPCSLKFGAYIGVLNVYRAIIVLGGIWGVIHLRKETMDYFYLYQELKIQFVLGCITFLLFALFSFFSGVAKFNETVFPISSFVAISYLTSFPIVCALYPGYLSYKGQNQQEMISMSSKSLNDIVSVKKGELAFVEFLKREFALENWLFKKEVDNFKSAAERLRSTSEDHIEDVPKMREELKKHAEDILNDFVEEAGLHQVNISGPVHEAIRQRINSWSELDNTSVVGIFDKAENEILELLELDSYRRFLRSPQYKRLIAHVKKQSLEQEALKVAGF
jgi:hypothetical protein